MTLVITFCGIFLVAAVLMIRAFRSPKSHRPVTAEWLAEMSVERYRPMLRLLDEADLEDLASQPGFRPEMIISVRKQRCEMFRRYLDNLAADFERAMHIAKTVAAECGKNRPELDSLLARTQARFARGVFLTQCRVCLYQRLGVGTVRADELIGFYEHVGAELQFSGAGIRSNNHTAGYRNQGAHNQETDAGMARA